VEESDLGHRLREDQIHRELQLNMPKKSYEDLNERNKLLFLAGLFDGEGSFGVWGKGDGRKSFQCSVEMCDRDSVKKFADFFGGNVVKPRLRKSHWTQTYKWKLSGGRAYECVEMMIEYMSQRRQEKYENVVQCT
tara:strand:- start:106 stop:510 length:405 start_codon:yes stop_codon:yes gene_type:complete